MTGTSTPLTVAEASKHLWEALSHHQVTLDLGAHDPVVRAVSAYGQACREHDALKTSDTSKKIWEELSHHSVTLDLSASDPFVKALAEYGEACRHEGVKAA